MGFRLKVNDTFIDVPQRVGQTFAVNEIGKLKTRSGGYSTSFDIPITNAINDALDYPFDLNNTSRKPYQKVRCELYNNSTYLVSGYLKYEVATKTKLRGSFFSDNAEWFSLIKDLDLKELDLSSLNHDWDRATIVASLSNTSGYIYPIIEYGDFVTQPNLEVDVTQLYPAVYLSSVFEALEDAIDWKFTGEFIDSAIFQKIIIPFSAEEFVHSQEYIDAASFTTDKDAAQSIPTSAVDITWDNGTDTEIEVPNAGNYIIRGQISLTGTVINNDINVYKFDGVTRTAITIEPDLNGFNTDGVKAFQSVDPVEMSASDTFIVEYVGTGGSSGSINTGADTFFRYELQPEIVEGSEIQVATILPDLTVTELLEWVFFSFGIVPQANGLSRKIRLDFHRNIKSRIDQAVDWTDKLHNGLQEVDFTRLVSGYASRSKIQYTEDDDDDTLLAYREGTGDFFGQGIISINNEHVERLETIYEAPFAPSIQVLSFSGLLYLPKINFKLADGTEEDKPKPKVLLIKTGLAVSELTGSVASSFTITGEGGSTNVATIPFAWFVKESYTTNTNSDKSCLAYGAPVFDINDTPLREAYLLDYEAALNSMKYFRARFNLDEVDITQLDFTIPVYIGGNINSYFYLNKVEQYDGRSLTTVELIKIP